MTHLQLHVWVVHFIWHRQQLAFARLRWPAKKASTWFCGFVQGRNMHKQYRNGSRCLHDQNTLKIIQISLILHNLSYLSLQSLVCEWTRVAFYACIRLHQKTGNKITSRNIGVKHLNLQTCHCHFPHLTRVPCEKKVSLPAPLAIATVVGCDLLYLGWCVSCWGWSSRVHRWRA